MKLAFIVGVGVGTLACSLLIGIKVQRLEGEVRELQANSTISQYHCAKLPTFRPCALSFPMLAGFPAKLTPRQVSVVGYASVSRGTLRLYSDPIAAFHRVEEGSLRIRAGMQLQRKLIAESKGKLVRINGSIKLGPNKYDEDPALGELKMATYHVLPAAYVPETDLLLIDPEDLDQ